MKFCVGFGLLIFLLTMVPATHAAVTTFDDVSLADYRFDNSSDDYIISEWTWIDLSDLGAVYGLEFSFSSSDGGSGYSMNTPAYFGMDNLTTVPILAAVWML